MKKFTKMAHICEHAHSDQMVNTNLIAKGATRPFGANCIYFDFAPARKSMYRLFKIAKQVDAVNVRGNSAKSKITFFSAC